MPSQVPVSSQGWARDFVPCKTKSWDKQRDLRSQPVQGGRCCIATQPAPVEITALAEGHSSSHVSTDRKGEKEGTPGLLGPVPCLDRKLAAHPAPQSPAVVSEGRHRILGENAIGGGRARASTPPGNQLSPARQPGGQSCALLQPLSRTKTSGVHFLHPQSPLSKTARDRIQSRGLWASYTGPYLPSDPHSCTL